MKIWTLTENTTLRPDLTAEHGLSLYIETGSHRILFDTGKTGAFADNAKKMGVDLSRVDLCVISHGHYDHGGGIRRFLAENDSAPVYLQESAFGAHFSSGNYIGLDPALEAEPRLRFVSGDPELAPGIRLYSCADRQRPCPFGVFGQTVLRNGCHREEDYRHEQYLLLEEDGRRFCISGCSHRGILNIAHWFRPDVLIGGFHLMKIDPADPMLADAARYLLESGAMCYTGHCTGQAQYDALKAVMGSRLEKLQTGTVLSL